MLKSGRPRHEQISDWLRSQISESVFSVNEKLPSESELGERFEVSRITVRRALQTLENEGAIYRRQGLGSFVREGRVQQGLIRLNDFVEDMTAAGIRASSRILHFAPEKADAVVAAALSIDENKSVFRLDRLRLGDGEPVAFDRTWLPAFYAHLLEPHNLAKETIYGVLENEYDIPIMGGRFRIEAVNATQDIAEVLQIPVRRALLLIERISFAAGDKCVYFQRRYYRSDKVAYELFLERKRGGGSLSPPLQEFEPVFSV